MKKSALIFTICCFIFISAMIGGDVYNKDWDSLKERGMVYAIIVGVILVYNFVKQFLSNNNNKKI